MTRIEVTPASLADTAARLGTTDLAARQARRALAAADPQITGSAELSAALSEHAEAWGWCLERLQERLLAGSRALADAARAYEQVDRSAAAAAAPRYGSPSIAVGGGA